MSRKSCIAIGALVATAAGILLATAATAQVPPKDLDCAQASDALRRAAAKDRFTLAVTILEQKCRPLPAGILSALRAGVWEDGATVPGEDRMSLLTRGTQAAYAEAETLTVALLEAGHWPDGHELSIEDGSRLIASLAPVLNPYRTRLLLDVYEQVPATLVRIAVIRALHGAALPEAILPALDASFLETGPLQATGMWELGTTEKRDLALARLLRELPAGPALEWAKRLSPARGK